MYATTPQRSPVASMFAGTSMPSRDWWAALFPDPSGLLRTLGVRARLSGLAVVPLECQLRRVEIGWRLGFEETIQAPAMHQIGADQSGEDERTVDGLLRRLGETEQQKGDQRDGDLDAHGIFRGAEKAADFEGLLD